MAESPILIIITCSNTKRTGGVSAYDGERSILPLLPAEVAEDLIQGRKWAFGRLLTGGAKRDAVLVRDLPPNRSLAMGHDLGGEAAGALYRPAAERYAGRLYKELQHDGKQMLLATPHHVLILSGLYGLLIPSEPIQDYQSYVRDDRVLTQLWTESGLLTNVLIAYVKSHGITHIFDLTAERGYRELIDWHRTKAVTKQVLHCFASQDAGPDGLVAVGYSARQLLSASTAELTTLRDGSLIETPYQRLVLTEALQEPSYAPREGPLREVSLTIEDQLGRMRRCFIRIMDAMDPRQEGGRESGVIPHIHALVDRGRIPYVVGRCMVQITQVRNTREYEPPPRAVTDGEWLAIRVKFAEVKKWASQHKLPVPADCDEI